MHDLISPSVTVCLSLFLFKTFIPLVQSVLIGQLAELEHSGGITFEITSASGHHCVLCGHVDPKCRSVHGLSGTTQKESLVSSEKSRQNSVFNLHTQSTVLSALTREC